MTDYESIKREVTEYCEGMNFDTESIIWDAIHVYGAEHTIDEIDETDWYALLAKYDLDEDE